MPDKDLPPLTPIDGEIIHSSVAESLAGVVLFSLMAAGGAALLVLPIIAKMEWNFIVGGLVVGALLLFGGVLATRAMLHQALSKESLVIGTDRIQLVKGKENTVVGQVPYANIAAIELEKPEGNVGSGSVGITLRDWNDPQTRWPGGVEGYQFHRDEGWHEVIVGTGYKKKPKKIMEMIVSRYQNYQTAGGAEAKFGPMTKSNPSFKEKVLLIKIAAVVPIALAAVVVIFVIDWKDGKHPAAPAMDPVKQREEVLAGLRSPNAAERRQACAALAKFRPATKENVETLAAALADKDVSVRAGAAGALAELAPMLEAKPDWAAAAVPAAIKALADADAAVVLPAIVTLGHSGPAGRVAIAPLKKQMSGGDIPLRLAAVAALVRLDRSQADEAIPVAVALIDDPNVDIRKRAVQTVAQLGDLANHAAPALVRVIAAEGDSRLRIDAAEALLQVNPAAAPQAVPGLVALISDIDRQTGGKLKKPSLVKGPDGRIVLSNPDALNHPLHLVRSEALAVLRRIDPKAAEKVNQ